MKRSLRLLKYINNFVLHPYKNIKKLINNEGLLDKGLNAII